MTRVLTLWKHGVMTGLLGGLITILLSLIEMVEAFSQRQIVSGILSMDQCLLAVAAVFVVEALERGDDTEAFSRMFAALMPSGETAGGMLEVMTLAQNGQKMEAVKRLSSSCPLIPRATTSRMSR